ncbi:MAG: HAD family phosphatase [Proteobacteria bacterium]|nr:HAD family phosphatase [Pseudomonadota bacterium]
MNKPNRPYDLICFDIDGTLVRHRDDKVIWQVLNARYTGTDTINEERHRMFHEGKISYARWVELDVQGWINAGATRPGVLSAVEEFQCIAGATETLDELAQCGIRLAVISGTLDVVIDTMFPEHPFGDVYSNRLIFDDDDRLVGWEATPFDQKGKEHALRELSQKYGVDLSRTAFVGDGDNDVSVIGVAGCVVALNPRSAELERNADHVLHTDNIRNLIEILR